MKNSGFSINDIKEPVTAVTHFGDKTAGAKSISAFIRSVIIVFPICAVNSFGCIFGFEGTVIYEKIVCIVFSCKITVSRAGPIALKPFLYLVRAEILTLSQDNFFSG